MSSIASVSCWNCMFQLYTLYNTFTEISDFLCISSYRNSIKIIVNHPFLGFREGN